jgi:hypothetical protein
LVRRNIEPIKDGLSRSVIRVVLVIKKLL